MGRPSVTEARRKEILDAFEFCVAAYGVEGATLEKVAEQAGLARALIRHHVGNREELLDALVVRFLSRSRRLSAQFVDALPLRSRVLTLVDWLFDPKYVDPQLVRVAEALIAAVPGRSVLAKQMRDWVRAFVTMIEGELQAEFPDQPGDRIRAVAAGITGIYFNVDSLAPLGSMVALRNASREAAVLLVSTLDREDDVSPRRRPVAAVESGRRNVADARLAYFRNWPQAAQKTRWFRLRPLEEASRRGVMSLRVCRALWRAVGICGCVLSSFFFTALARPLSG